MGIMKKRLTRVQKRNIEKNLVTKANLIEDPLTEVPNASEYTTKDNKVLKLSCVKAPVATTECKAWVMDLTERNMKQFYQQCEWGWDPTEKEKELTEPEAMYLIASLDDKHVGFSHFRFDIDDNDAVLYCYELQLEEPIRNKGLGHFMMHILETMATQAKMKRVVLTVLKSNPTAVQFFTNLGYRRDKTNNPNADYQIISKQMTIR